MCLLSAEVECDNERPDPVCSLIGNSATQYNNIRYVLKKLGVPLGNGGTGIYPDHEHHFHIAMGIPTLKSLPENLAAETLPKEQSMIDITPQALPDVSQLWAQADVPSISRPVEDWIGADLKDRRFIQDWIQHRSKIEEFYEPRYSENGPLQIPTLKYNLSVDYAPRRNSAGKFIPNEQMVNFGRLACMLMDSVDNKAGTWGPECKITQFIQRPGGKLVPDNQSGALPGAQMYFPSRAGMHTARFILENGAGRKLDVTVKIRALLDTGYGKYDEPDTASLLADLGADDYPAWLRSAQLSALIANAQSAVTSYQNLPATALGQTIAQGASASITLDTTAAGHGWYVDPTPLDATDEYLPTSSPNIWKAKANSAAAGKIDLLSVLLHEYGHALGLSHSSDASDFMAAKLQPAYSRFVRRLPSAAELQKMSELVAQTKETSPQPSARGRGSDNPFDLNNPHPFASSPPAIIRLSPRKLMARLVNV